MSTLTNKNCKKYKKFFVSFLFLFFIHLQKRQNKNKMFPMQAHNRIMIMTLLLSNITEKHNYPRRGYKRNKYRLPHHDTIVTNAVGSIPIVTSFFLLIVLRVLPYIFKILAQAH